MLADVTCKTVVQLTLNIELLRKVVVLCHLHARGY
jgi:hypothetical protein